MSIIKTTTPAKTILFGEHAVVYGYPAIAIPVDQLRTTITVHPNLQGNPNEIIIDASDIGLHENLFNLPALHPFQIAFQAVTTHLKISHYPACYLKIRSTIPIASGLGSSASVSVGLIKAFSQFVGANLPPETIIDLAYQVETIFHGTPSGIDNTVIGFEKGVLYQKGKNIQLLESALPLHIVIANSGIPGNTKEAVNHVRLLWEKDPSKYEQIFKTIGTTTLNAAQAFKTGDKNGLGQLMITNHHYLTQLEVSHPSLDLLVKTAIEQGALGAKLCGGGLGGNIIALIHPDDADKIRTALHQKGATQTFLTTIERFIP